MFPISMFFIIERNLGRTPREWWGLRVERGWVEEDGRWGEDIVESSRSIFFAVT